MILGDEFGHEVVSRAVRVGENVKDSEDYAKRFRAGGFRTATDRHARTQDYENPQKLTALAYAAREGGTGSRRISRKYG